MTDISSEQAKRLQANLDSGKLSPAVAAKVQAALDSFHNQTAELASHIDPEHPVLPQVMATQPATTHPDGDQAAADEWVRAGPNPTGTTVVYETPLLKVKQRLLEDPSLGAAATHGATLSPEEIQGLGDDSSIVQYVRDQDWRQTAEAAVGGGRTAYRYSKAPWLQGGLANLGQKLSASLLPGLEGIQAFVMGQDDTATFGAMRALSEHDSSKPEEPAGMPPRRAELDAYKGGAYDAAKNQTELGDILEEEHPVAYTAGQVYGAVPGLLSGAVKAAGKGIGLASKATGEAVEAVGRTLESLKPWSATNELFDAVAKGNRKLLAKVGITEGFAPVATAALSAGAAGAVTQAAQEGVDATASYLQTGDPGTGLWDAAVRSAHGALAPGILGGAGGVLQQLSSGTGNWVREGNRYGGVPGRLEKAGVPFEFGKGPVTPPAIARAEARAKELDTTAEDVMAQELAPKIQEGAKAVRQEAVEAVEKENTAFHASEEGQKQIPVRSAVEETVQALRGDMEKRQAGARLGKGEVPDPVGYAHKGRDLKELLAQSVDDVSLDPVEGAIAVTPEEAEAFLSPEAQKLIGKTKRAPAPEAKAPFPPASDVSNPRAEMTRPGVIEDAGPPRHLPTTKEGVGDWRDPKAIDTPAPVVPDRMVRADGSYESMLAARDARAAYEAGALPPRGQAPVPPIYDQQAPVTPGLRGGRQSATGTPPAATGDNIKSDLAGPGPLEPRASRVTELPTRQNVGQAPGLAPPRQVAEPKAKGSGTAERLRSRGVETVYIVPRAHDAEHTETLLDAIKGYKDANPKDKDLIRIDQAARRDRDVRTREGKAKGWSELKTDQSKRLDAAKEVEKRAAPKGKSHGAIIRYGTKSTGEAPRVAAMRAAADKAGPETRQQLEQVRIRGPLKEMQERISFGKVKGKPQSIYSPSAATDAVGIRLGYPVIKALEGPLGPLGSGKAGKLGTVDNRFGPEPAEERRREAARSPREERYRALRDELIKRNKSKRERRVTR